MFKKAAKLMLTAALTASMLAPSATIVFAEVVTDDGVKIDATVEDEEVHLKDVKSDEHDAVEIKADNGHVAEVTTGNLESEKAAALDVDAKNGSTVDVYVDGSAVSDTAGDECGVIVIAGNSPGKDDSNVDVTIKGNAQGCIGAEVEAGNGSTVTVTIEGDALGTNNVWGSSTGLQVNSYRGGTANVIVNGDSIGNDEKTDRGAYVGSYEGNSNVFIGGNVDGDYGLCSGAGNNGKNNIVVEGTVHGEKAGVIVSDSDGGESSITVWKVETDKDGVIAGKYDDDGNLVEDKEAEKKIQYIVKVDQPKGATLTATDANGKALATVTAVNGKTFEYAHQGDKVLLKVDVDKDYSLDAVYGDKGQQYKLVKDASGNYYVEVPAGGGVYFSAVLSKKEKDKDEDKKEEEKAAANTNATTVTPATTALAVEQAAVQAAVTSISSTPVGGTANVAVTGTSIDSSVVRMLLARRDINVSLACFVNGKLCSIMIPAGADLSDIIKPDGTIDVEKLAKKFGKTEVQ